MTLLLVGCLCLVIGWIARGVEDRAAVERAAERLRPHGPPRSHCRPLARIYDQETDRG